MICGLEHSGTTLVSELLRQVPGVDAGFEVGALLAETPRDFPLLQPYAEHMLWGWGLTQEAFLSCCETDSFDIFYERLRVSATKLRPNTHVIYDKTPRYLAALELCMSRVVAPFIVTYKDPRSTVYSDFKSSGRDDFDRWFDEYAAEKIGYMRLHYAEFLRARDTRDPRVCLVRLEDLCLYPHLTCDRIFAHVGYRFDLGYLSFRGERYQNTRVGSIAIGLPFEYRTALDARRHATIAKKFAGFEAWFFE